MGETQVRLLLVDDDALMRRALGRSLRLDFPVVEAGTYADALQLAGKQGLWGAFVVDYMIPAGAGSRDPEPLGINLLRRLRTRYPGVPGMLVTGVLNEKVTNACAEIGVLYLHKSFRLEALRPFSARVARFAAPLRWSELESMIRDTGVTPREADVIRLRLVDGLTNPETAARLGISLSTVKSHVRSVLSKTGDESVDGLRAGILSLRRGRVRGVKTSRR